MDDHDGREGQGPANVRDLFDEGGVVTAGLPASEPEGGSDDAVRAYLKRIGKVRLLPDRLLMTLTILVFLPLAAGLLQAFMPASLAKWFSASAAMGVLAYSIAL